MLKGILTILLFVFIVLVVVVLMITNVIFRTFRRMKQHIENQRDEENDAYFRRYSQKSGNYTEEKVVFDKNYFDSVDNYGWEKKTRKEQPKSTTTKEGTVIIDHRTPKENNKKIYDDGEGEYVEFSEVTD